MAQKIQMIVSTVDDFDGTDGATETRKFSVGRAKNRVIDLTEANAVRFDDVIALWTAQRVKRTLTVGRKVHELALTQADADAFDADMAEWLEAARRHDKAERQAAPPGATQDSPKTAPRAAVAAPPDADGTLDPRAPDAPGVDGVAPVVGEEWWRGASDVHKRARKIVRRWAKSHGFPGIGERGRIPIAAYDKWVAKVWSTLDNPSWPEAERQSSASSRRRPRRTTESTEAE
jgi:hypothetical protein